MKVDLNQRGKTLFFMKSREISDSEFQHLLQASYKYGWEEVEFHYDLMHEIF